MSWNTVLSHVILIYMKCKGTLMFYLQQ